MTRLATTVLADTWPYHHDLGTGGWILMMLGMLIFWGAIIALVVWAVRGGLTTRRDDTPEEILRKRLADGSISVEEYEQRRAALTSAPTPSADRPVGPPSPGHP